MKKIVKLKKLCSRPLQIRYQVASAKEREAMRPVIEEESQWVIRKMAKKGYQLEATVLDVYGVFTRGPAKQQLQPVAAASSAEGVTS